MKSCRACHAYTPMLPVIDLGKQPPANAFLGSPHEEEHHYPLSVAVCSRCWLMQLSYDADPRELFPPGYVYRSSGSKTLVDNARAYCDMIIPRLRLERHSRVVEVGSNDGYLLKNFVRYCFVMGVEPAALVAAEAWDKHEVHSVVARFESAVLPWQADLLIANNVMAHTPDLRDFVAAIERSLAPTGTATIEFTNTLELLKGGYWDSIYHEHYSYLSLRALEPLLQYYGLYVYDVDRLAVQGASLRLYLEKRVAHIGSEEVKKLREDERALSDPELYRRFAQKARTCIERFRNFARGKHLAGYGAAAKGNTFLNSMRLGRPGISMVADTTSAKVGLFLPGSHIPVVAEADLIASKPEYILLLAWNWREEAVARLRALGYTGKFVIAVPELEVFE